MEMKTKLLSLIIAGIAILGLSMGTVTYAYTSTLNPVDPTTAPESYVINIPDEELKKTLNHIISNVPPLTTRSENQDITVKDARRVGLMYGGQ